MQSALFDLPRPTRDNRYEEIQAGLPEGTVLLYREGNTYYLYGKSAEIFCNALGESLYNDNGNVFTHISADKLTPFLECLYERGIYFCAVSEMRNANG